MSYSVEYKFQRYSRNSWHIFIHDSSDKCDICGVILKHNMKTILTDVQFRNRLKKLASKRPKIIKCQNCKRSYFMTIASYTPVS